MPRNHVVPDRFDRIGDGVRTTRRDRDGAPSRTCASTVKTVVEPERNDPVWIGNSVQAAPVDDLVQPFLGLKVPELRIGQRGCASDGIEIS